MANYIWSSTNRFYAALEQTYGVPVAISSGNRIPAVGLQARQTFISSKRRDKTGTRTLSAAPLAAIQASEFVLSSHLTAWSGSGQPFMGPLVQAALGSSPYASSGLIVAGINDNELETASPHSLSAGAAVSVDGEIRFVAEVSNATNVVLNASFSTPPAVGTELSPTMSYSLANSLPSVSLYDYWDPAGSVSRLIAGAGVDRMGLLLKGDYHELTFSGPAANVLDANSLNFGNSGLSAFPAEPDLTTFDYAIVPGQLGEVWMGSPASQFFTMTEALVTISNNLSTRAFEFGSSYPTAIVPGPREISTTLALYTQDGAETIELYTAAKNRVAIPVVIQMGRQQGQLMAVYLPRVVPEIPDYDETHNNLLWQFKSCTAIGKENDEAYIAFA